MEKKTPRFNEELNKSFEDFSKERNQESYDGFIRKLVETIEGDYDLFVPVRDSSLGSSDSYMVPATLSASNGQWYYIAFTSAKQAEKHIGEAVTVMPIAAMLNIVKESKNCGGICFDPWDNNGLFIPYQYVDAIMNEAVSE